MPAFIADPLAIAFVGLIVGALALGLATMLAIVILLTR